MIICGRWKAKICRTAPIRLAASPMKLQRRRPNVSPTLNAKRQPTNALSYFWVRLTV